MFRKLFGKKKKTSAFGRTLKSKNDVIAFHVYCVNSNAKGCLIQHA